MTIHFVTGFMRCGTSMMMRALDESGLEAVYNDDRAEMNDVHGDDNYEPNPHGFYELSGQEYQAEDFPDKYEGKLVKLLHGGMWRVDPRPNRAPYRVVMMRRDPEEIRNSIEGFFEIQTPKTPPQYRPENIEAALDYCESFLEVRNDVELTLLWYRDVVRDPVENFEKLKYAGWPIDPEAAATVVDPDLLRFKKEELNEAV